MLKTFHRRQTMISSSGLAAFSDHSMNRLSTSKSPYLRQHAQNPVHWYPWGGEAFSAAATQNKPIFLSIGYSTCHWCHVMAHESFEDEETAKLMNEHFINIKVDREERPDIDRQYMLFVQATTGSAGWPLSVFLTPQRIPFFGGTYFGKESNGPYRPSFQSVLNMISERWQNDSGSLVKMGQNALDQLKRTAEFSVTGPNRSGDLMRTRAAQRAFTQIRQSFDSQYGGFGTGSKFAMPSTLGMLLNYSLLWRELGNDQSTPPLSELRRTAEALNQHDIGNTIAEDDQVKISEMWRGILDGGKTLAAEATSMLNKTLIALVQGGIYDHVGGGFHRYSVDRAWSLPHFEKMLYDQAQLIKILAEAWAAQGKPANSPLAAAVKETIAYCNDVLLDQATGAYYAAEDADSLDPATGKNGEGNWATWTDAEVNEVLRSGGWNDQQLKLFKYHFTVLPRGNVRGAGAHDPALQDKNVLVNRNPIEVSASKTGFKEDEARALISAGLRLLKERRDMRPRPGRDEKILAGWNGLMLSALATAARIFDDDSYLQMAERLAQFIYHDLTVCGQHGGGDSPLRVLKRFMMDGVVVSDVDGYAADYAMTISGLLDLHQACLKSEYIDAAESLYNSLDVLFRDKAGFGYFAASPYATQKHDEPIVATKEDSDGVEPSTNSLSAWNCLRLYHLSGKKVYNERFKQILRVFTRHLDTEPQAMTALISALIIDIIKPKVLILNRHPDADDQARQVFQAVRGSFAPNILVLIRADGNGKPFEGHVCQGTTCSAPTSNVSSIVKDQLCL